MNKTCCLCARDPNFFLSLHKYIRPAHMRAMSLAKCHSRPLAQTFLALVGEQRAFLAILVIRGM